jgi:hypothetical protein
MIRGVKGDLFVHVLFLALIISMADGGELNSDQALWETAYQAG